MIRHASFAAAALLALAACAPGPRPAPPPVDASMAAPVPTRLVGYLSADALDGRTVIGPPPAPGSPRDIADRATYDAQRSLAGTARWRLAIADNDLWNGGAMKRFTCAMGREVSARATPVTLRMLQRVELDVRTVGVPPKDFYNRKRPALGNDKPICVAREAWLETNASYPSGHATTGWAWALILGEAQPAHMAALLANGREMGESRVICGVHYESDVEAGRTLGAAMVARLHADPAFVADLARARRELVAAPPAAGCGA